MQQILVQQEALEQDTNSAMAVYESDRSYANSSKFNISSSEQLSNQPPSNQPIIALIKQQMQMEANPMDDIVEVAPELNVNMLTEEEAEQIAE